MDSRRTMVGGWYQNDGWWLVPENSLRACAVLPEIRSPRRKLAKLFKHRSSRIHDYKIKKLLSFLFMIGVSVQLQLPRCC